MTVSLDDPRRLSDEESTFETDEPLLATSSSSKELAASAAAAAAAMAAAEAEQQRKKRGGLHPSIYIMFWIFLSSATIFHNKYILDDAGFRFPAILTCWHMTYATVMTQILARTTTFIDGRKKVKMTSRVYYRAILPIGVLYSLSLVGSNLVYLHLSVAFVQILKATSPAMILFAAWTLGVSNPDWKMWLNVVVIVIGIVIASFGEIHFVLFGCVVQILAVLFEAYRLALIQRLLSSEEFKMDPMVSLYYYAPVCAVLNGLVAMVYDMPTFHMVDVYNVGVWSLVANATIAFLLNVASVTLIGRTSALVLVLSGILKNILIVGFSMMIWGTIVTPLELFGYAISVLGLLYFNLGEEAVRRCWHQKGELWEHYGARLPRPRKFMIFLASLISFFLLGVSFAQVLYQYGLWPVQYVRASE